MTVLEEIDVSINYDTDEEDVINKDHIEESGQKVKELQDTLKVPEEQRSHTIDIVELDDTDEDGEDEDGSEGKDI